MSNTGRNLKIGQKCTVSGKEGVVKFIGITKFAAGVWVGVELNGPEGKNDGTVQGERYFDCKPSHGLFVRPVQVRAVKSGLSSVSRKPSTTSSASLSTGSAKTGETALERVRRRQAEMRAKKAAAAANTTGESSGTTTAKPSSLRPPSGIPRKSLDGTSGRLSLSSTASTTTSTNNVSPKSISSSHEEERIPVAEKSPTTASAPRSSFREPPSTIRKSGVTDSIPETPTKKEPLISSTKDESMFSPQKLKRERMVELRKLRSINTSHELEIERLNAELKDANEKLSRASSHTSTRRHSGSNEELKVTESTMSGVNEEEVRKLEESVTDLNKEVDTLRKQLKKEEARAEEAEIRFSEQRDSLQDSVGTLETKVSTLQNQLNSTRSELEKRGSGEASTLNQLSSKTRQMEELETKNAELEEMIELLAMEKEELKLEVEIAQEKMENAEEELVQAQIANETSGSTDTERLKQALLALHQKEQVSATEAKMQRERADEYREKADQVDIMINKIKILENQVEDLGLRADGQAGNEAMVERLSERNLELEDELAEVMTGYQELEQLRVVSEEMEQTFIDEAAQLRTENAGLSMQNSRMIAALQAAKGAMNEKMTTIATLEARAIEAENATDRYRDELQSNTRLLEDKTSRIRELSARTATLQRSTDQVSRWETSAIVANLDAALSGIKHNALRACLPSAILQGRSVLFLASEAAVGCQCLTKLCLNQRSVMEIVSDLFGQERMSSEECSQTFKLIHGSYNLQVLHIMSKSATSVLCDDGCDLNYRMTMAMDMRSPLQSCFDALRPIAVSSDDMTSLIAADTMLGSALKQLETHQSQLIPGSHEGVEFLALEVPVLCAELLLLNGDTDPEFLGTACEANRWKALSEKCKHLHSTVAGTIGVHLQELIAALKLGICEQRGEYDLVDKSKASCSELESIIEASKHGKVEVRDSEEWDQAVALERLRNECMSGWMAAAEAIQSELQESTEHRPALQKLEELLAIKEEELAKSRQRYTEAEVKYANLQRRAADSDSNIQSLREEITQLQKKETIKETIYSPRTLSPRSADMIDNSTVLEFKTKLAKAERRAKEAESEYESLRGSMEGLRRALYHARRRADLAQARACHTTLSSMKPLKLSKHCKLAYYRNQQHPTNEESKKSDEEQKSNTPLLESKISKSVHGFNRDIDSLLENMAGSRIIDLSTTSPGKASDVVSRSQLSLASKHLGIRKSALEVASIVKGKKGNSLIPGQFELNSLLLDANSTL